MKAAIATAIVLSSLLPACTTSEPEDGAGDDVSQGKADSPYSEGELAAAVRVANSLTLEELDADVPLSSRAAKNIVAARPFATVAELDAVAYVGPRAFGAMIEYARAQGWIGALPALSRVDFPTGSGHIAVADTQLAIVNTSLSRVHLFTRTATGWQPDATVAAQSGVTMFGFGLALEDDTLAVTGNAGTFSSPAYHTYVYTRETTGWSLTQTLDGGAFDVALGGNYLATGDSDPTTGHGQVRVYERANGVYQLRAAVEGQPQGYLFGSELAIGDGLLAVGARRDGIFLLDLDAGVITNAAVHKISGATASSIAVNRNILVAGSTADPQGAATIMASDATGRWRTTAVTAGPPGSTLTQPSFYGTTVAVLGDKVVVGAPHAGVTAAGTPTYEGGIYVYDQAGALLGWQNGAANTTLGVTVAAHGDTLVVSSAGEILSN